MPFIQDNELESQRTALLFKTEINLLDSGNDCTIAKSIIRCYDTAKEQLQPQTTNLLNQKPLFILSYQIVVHTT